MRPTAMSKMTHVSRAAGKDKVFLNTSFLIFKADVGTLCSIGHSGLEDETALAVLARVASVAHRLERGDFAN